jgi:TrmH family RNA methyltransferase
MRGEMADDGDTADEVLARWRAVAGDPRAVLLDGFHAVKHALRFGAPLELVVTADRARVLALAGSLAPDLAATLAALLVQVDPGTLAELTGGAHPTAVAGLARRPETTLREVARTAPLVLLDDPRHLGNVGAVVRVAAGLGAAAVLTTGTVDPWHPTVLRGAAGLHFALPVLRVDVAGLADLPGPVLALDAAGADIRGLTVPDGAALVFGSERRGVSAALRRRADALVALPMRRQVSSYNLATSVAMALYHWTLTRPGSHGAVTRPG